MQDIVIVGDVHGKVNQFATLVQRHPNRNIIQLGDFGFKREHDWLIERDYPVKVVFGNHDWLPYKALPHSLGDWAAPVPGLFTVRGAFSIDQWHRTEGKTWFADEELTYREGLDVLDAYTAARPEVVVTHDCPQSIRERVFGIRDRSMTSQLLQSLLEIHQPRLWVHGHHHQSLTTPVDGTRFVCLGELETYAL